MEASVKLVPLTKANFDDVRDIYRDAICSQGLAFYNKDQIEAWAALASLPGVLDRSLKEGQGWLIRKNYQNEAFAVRYPVDRLALLYCRGRSARHGFATRLLFQIESDAFREGIDTLRTEASLFSYRLLLKYGWIVDSCERIKIGGIDFCRYQMFKKL